MGHDMEESCRIACYSAKSYSHEDIADLGGRGKCHHPVDVVGMHRLQGPDDHAYDAEDQKDRFDRHSFKYRDSDRPVEHLDQKHDVSF